MIVYVFPGQASQFVGMGAKMYEESSLAKKMFEKANEILGFSITDVMFSGSVDDLKQTKVTQPAVFLHSVIKLKTTELEKEMGAVAGHSLGELSALVANDVLSFEDGLKLVQIRANAMQKACEMNPGTMAAIVGMEDEVIEEVCNEIDDIVVPANYNCPGQLVISGSLSGVETACQILKEKGAKRALMLPVGGAFHSPLMLPAKEELEKAIMEANFNTPTCPIYQNVTGQKEIDPNNIKSNLIDQLTSPVKWTQTMNNMVADGLEEVIEVGGTGKVISGFFRRVDRSIHCEPA